MENLKEVSNIKHIGIIMDGNRRWAKEKKLDKKFGHKEGAKTIEKIVRYANKIGLEYITVYAFSTENWKRTEDEVGALMILLKNYLEDFSKKADTENIRIRVIGGISRLSDELQKSINSAIERTKNNTGTTFVIAFNYGGRDEIIRAVKNISSEVKNGNLNIDDINENVISDNLYTSGIPDPDLIIRTSGEMRLSGFLTWQSVYSELYFINKYWPDFNEQDLDEAIIQYTKRNRKYGAQ